MKKIFLVCGAGMSTSLLVQKMIKASESKKENYEIHALPSTGLEGFIEEADVILLGPQVSYMKNDLGSKYSLSAAIEVINSIDYGTMNGVKVLDRAIKLIDMKEKGEEIK